MKHINCIIVKPFLQAFILGLVLISCTNGEGNTKSHSELDVKFEIEECYFLRPDFTYNYANLSSYSKSKIDDVEYISSLSNGSVYIFEAKTGVLADKIKIESEGPMSVGKGTSNDGVLYLGNGKLLYSSNTENKIFLIERDKVSIVVDLSKRNDRRLASLFQNVPIEGGGHYIFPMYPNTEKEMGKGYSFIAIDKVDLTFEEVISYAPVYAGRFYGTTPYLYWPSITYNDEKEKYVVSFPIDHRVFEYDSDFNPLREHNLFSETIGDIPVYDKPLDENGSPNWEDNRAYFGRLNGFIGIYYLKDSRKYVRIGRVMPQENVEMQHFAIIYNESFTKMEEFTISPDYSVYNLIPLSGSVHFLNVSRLENEKTIELPFDCFMFK